MIPAAAIARFVDRQKSLLVATYNEAWKGGVASYQPVGPMHEADRHAAARAGTAALAPRAANKYLKPSAPDALRRAAALAPAFKGLDSMTGELSALAPSGAAAGVDAATGGSTLVGSVERWAASAAARLDSGDSAAWAGEQAGYAEAADADGQLLEWVDSGDDSECSDCETLASMPPMALPGWPCSPGDGATACNVGCRCSFEASEQQVIPGDDYEPDLSTEQQGTVDRLMEVRRQASAQMMSDAQYLS